MSGTSKYKIKYEEELKEKNMWRERALIADDEVGAIKGIIFGLKRDRTFEDELKPKRNVVDGVRDMKSKVSRLSATVTSQAVELARAWHMIRVFSGDQTLNQETVALMEALKSGKLHEYHSFFSPSQE